MGSNSTPISLYNAGLFSALAYAPNGQINSQVWGLLQPAGSSAHQAADTLLSEGWTDVTADLPGLLPSAHLGAEFYVDPGSNTAFHVWQNALTGQVVFAFRGSTPPVTLNPPSVNLTNWASDLTTSDQGASAYSAISKLAQPVLDAMKQSSLFGSDQFYADGHSLGGGIAQTFAMVNSLNGFGQDALPIAPTEVTALGGQSAIAAYENSHSFQLEALQGDIATAYYRVALGETADYASPSIALWVKSNYGTSETQLTSALTSQWASIAGVTATYDLYAGLLLDGISGHSLDALNLAVPSQVGPGGTIINNGTPDNTSTQSALGGLLNTLASSYVIKYLLSSLEANVDGQTSSASLPPATDNQVNPSNSAYGVAGLGAPFNLISGAGQNPTELKGDSGTDLILPGSQPTQILAGTGTDYIVVGAANSTVDGGAGTDLLVFDVSQAKGSTTETIINPGIHDALIVSSSSGNATLTGATPSTTLPYVWADNSGGPTNGTTYSFVGPNGASQGVLTISGGALNTNQIVIQGLNLTSAQSSAGFMGIKLPPTSALNAGANTGNQAGYRLGIRINSDVLDSLRQRYTAERDLARTRYDTLLQGLKLKAAAGMLQGTDLAAIDTMLIEPGQ